MMDSIYNLEELAAKLGLSERDVREKLNAGTIKGYKKGKKWYALHSDIIEYIKGAQDEE